MPMTYNMLTTFPTKHENILLYWSEYDMVKIAQKKE